MIQLSVVIIAFNEEANIGRCLESVRDVADEVVVVDSFSTDRTAEICRESGARVVPHAFGGHVEQKNWAVAQARYPHVLSLDADEALSPELRRSILAVKREWTRDGYACSRLTSYCGTWIRHGGWYPDRKLRLFDSRKGRWTGTNPHDRYELQPGCTVGRLRGDLLHYSYPSIRSHLEQVNYFTDIMAEEDFRSGRNAGIAGMTVRSLWRVIRGYVLQGGFLDGFHGLVIAAVSGHARFVRLAKLRQKRREEGRGR